MTDPGKGRDTCDSEKCCDDNESAANLLLAHEADDGRPRPKYRLIYFDIRGRAEPTRLAFHFASIDFVDMRVTMEQWCKIKPKAPFGQLPMLVVDNQVVAQSNAILRFVGKRAGLYPADDMEAARVDETMDLVDDIAWRIIPTLREKDMERKMAMRKELATETLPKWLAFLNRRFCRGYVLGGDRVSIADLVAFNLIEWISMGVIDGVSRTIAEPHKNLIALHERVLKHPKLQGYFAKHYNANPLERAKQFARAVERVLHAEKCECKDEGSTKNQDETHKEGRTASTAATAGTPSSNGSNTGSGNGTSPAHDAPGAGEEQGNSGKRGSITEAKGGSSNDNQSAKKAKTTSTESSNSSRPQ